MLSGGTGGGLFGTPQSGLGRGTGLGAGAGGLGANTGGSLFGRQAGGLFGGGGLGATGGGGGLFGQTPSTQQSGILGGGATGGLFGGGGLAGGGVAGGGLFQTPQSTLQQKTTGGMFGQSPMLGGGVNTGGNVLGTGLFNQANTTGGGGGIFGNKPQTSSGLQLGQSAGSLQLGQSAGGLQLGQSTGGLQLGQTPGGLQLGQTTGGLGGLQTGGGMFGGGGGIGGAGVQGTAVAKYEPAKSTDTLNKNGVTVTVHTLLHCVTASNSYMQKSMEELRFEDYSVGRKGPSGVVGAGGLFGGGTGLGGAGGLFGQNKGLGTGLGGLGTQTQLGGATSTGGGGLFGNQNKLGGGGGMFGNTPAQTQLGARGLGVSGGGLFGGQQTSQAGGGLFGGGNTGGGLFQQQQTAQLGGLGAQNQLGGGGLFSRGGTGLNLGQTGGLGMGGGLGTTGGGLGTLGTTGGLGGLGGVSQASGSLNLFNKPAGTGLGTGLGLGQTQLGGGLNLSGGAGGIGAGGLNLGGGGLNTGFNKLGGGSLLGGGVGLGANTLGGQSMSLGQSTLQQQQQDAQLKQQLEILANSPFGDSPLFRSAIFDASKQQKSKNSPTPLAAKPSPNTHQYKLNMRPSAKVKTISLSSPSRHKEKNRLFEGLEDSPLSTSSNSSFGAGNETFVPRKSVKKLNIKPKPSQPHTWPDSTTPPTDPPVVPSPILSSTSNRPHTAPLTPEDQARAEKNTPTPTSEERASITDLETPEITLGTSALKKPGIRSLTGSSPIGASPALPQPRKSSVKKVTLLEPVEEEMSLTRSLLGHTPPKSTSPPAQQAARGRGCGIVLTDPTYYIIPSLEECDQLTNESTCFVEDFIIGRKGKGKIHFPGTTDVYGLNLDKIVNIGVREVVVYPDDLPDPTPMEGEELNKRAFISMEGFWPKDKTTGDFIRDEDRLQAMNYRLRLERIVTKTGGQFIEYKPETGTCVFQVEHFSKYKLDADDSEEEGDTTGGTVIKKLKTVQKQLPLQPLSQAPASMTPPPPPPPPAHGQEEDIQMDSPNASVEDEMVVESTGLLPAQELVGSQTHHVQIMKASFFSKKDDLNQTYSILSPRIHASIPSPRIHASIPSPRIHTSSRPGSRLDERVGLQVSSRAGTHQSPALSRSVLQTSFLTSTAAPSPYPLLTPLHEQAPPQWERSSAWGEEVAPDPFSQFHRSHRPFIPPQAPVTPLQAQSAVLMAKRDLQVLLPAKEKMDRMLCDHALFMGRSFRVGWGPNWTLAHSGVQLAPTSEASTENGWSQGGLFSSLVSRHSAEKGHPIRVVLEQVSINSSPDSCDSFEPFLMSQLHNTEFVDGNDSQPRLCRPVAGTTLLNAFCDVARGTPLPSPKESGGEWDVQTQLRRILQLMGVLWGDLPARCSAGGDMYDHQQVRKRRLFQWLSDNNREKEPTSPPESEEEYLKVLFNLATGQQFAAACRLAQQRKDHKLALLLSQAVYSSQHNRVFLCHQLDCWGKQGVQDSIHHLRLKLYVLLAGLLTWHQQSGEQTHVNTCEGLDWKRSLALHLNYSCKLSSSILGVLHAYKDGFHGDNAYAPPPYPPYVEARDLHANTTPPPPYDTCYHLLELYCHREHSVELIVQPAASTPHQLDYRISWIVWSLLCSLDYSHMHRTTASQLLTSFASQLERCGKWAWSIFVLLHLEDPDLSGPALQDALARNCCSAEELSPEELFVVEQLHVPKEWVYCGKAQRAGYEEWYDLKALHMLSAGQWNSAHSVIMENLAVDAIINDDTADLLHMLERLGPPERSGRVQIWECRGSVFFDYLQIKDKFRQLSSSSDEPSQLDLETLHFGLKQLTARIDQLPSDSPREVLCRSEIAQKTADYIRAILQLKAKFADNPQQFVTQEIINSLRLLPIPPDYAITEYRALLQTHANNLTPQY